MYGSSAESVGGYTKMVAVIPVKTCLFYTNITET
jgi:hypothetical protein